MLQELEEQKAKLEQMLLEAQQEREHLKAAVTQEVQITQPEVHEQEVTSDPTTEVEPYLSFSFLVFSLYINSQFVGIHHSELMI